MKKHSKINRLYNRTVSFRSGILNLITSYSIRQSLAAGGWDVIPLTEEGVREALRTNARHLGSGPYSGPKLEESLDGSVSYTTSGGLSFGWGLQYSPSPIRNYIFWVSHSLEQFPPVSSLFTVLKQESGWQTEEELLRGDYCRTCGKSPIENIWYPYCSKHIVRAIIGAKTKEEFADET